MVHDREDTQAFRLQDPGQLLKRFVHRVNAGPVDDSLAVLGRHSRTSTVVHYELIGHLINAREPGFTSKWDYRPLFSNTWDSASQKMACGSSPDPPECFRESSPTRIRRTALHARVLCARCCRCSLEERQQFLVDPILMGGAHPVRSARNNLQYGALDELGRQQGRVGDRHDLIVIAVQD